MKRFLLVCSLVFAASASGVYAQSGKPVLDTKATFMAKIAEMNDNIDKVKVAAANTNMDELNTMMSTQLRYSKHKIKDAYTAADTAAVSAGRKQMWDKWTIYNDMSNYTSNLTVNKATVNSKLNDFMLVMD